MKIGYVVHNLADPAVERRCVMLERGGADIVLAGFARDAALPSAVRRRSPLVLGMSGDAAFVERTLGTLKVALLNKQLSKRFADCDVILARNLEQLAIARTVVGSRPLVYECLDIHRFLVGNNLTSKIIRSVEGALLPRVNLLLTSSPAFLREHFDHRPLNARTYLIENKMLIADSAGPESVPLTVRQPIKIGWFGMLRCQKTLSFLTQLVARSHGKIEVLICGKPSEVELPDFAQQVKQVPGMHFYGAYSYDDLHDLYGQCHFAWTIDWFEEGLNSSWLLPNRLYEALAHGSVPIALANIEVGRWLSRHNCGLLVADPQAATDRLLNMTPEEIDEMQAQLTQVERRSVVADTSDCRALVGVISEARA